MCDDVVNQLYACGSITGQTETETELTCDAEHNNMQRQLPAASAALWSVRALGMREH